MANAKQFKITIPEPCKVPWGSMSEVDDLHRHCASCQKVVIDFSQMSDDELVSYFSKKSGNSCGRFTSHQLNRYMHRLPEHTEKMRWWKIMLLLPLALFSKNARAQFYLVMKNPPVDTNAAASILATDSTQLVRQDTLDKGNTVASDSLADSGMIAADSIVADSSNLAADSPEKQFDVIQLLGLLPNQPLISSGAFIVGNVCAPPSPESSILPSLIEESELDSPHLTKGPPYDVVPFYPAADKTEVASIPSPKDLSDEPEIPEPPKPVIPADSDLNAVIPQQRKRFWRS